MNVWEHREFANGRYTDLVQNAERRALHLPLAEPQSRGSRRLHRSAANGPLSRRASRRHGVLFSRAASAHGD